MDIALVLAVNPQATGVDRYASELLAAFSRQGLDAWPVRLRRRELRVAGRAVGGVVSLWAQRAWGASPRARLVHALDPAAAGRRVDVVTVHDLIPETHPEWGAPKPADRVDWWLARRAAKRARVLVAVSEATRRQVVERWGVDAERVRVVHHGIDLERFRPVQAPSPWADDASPSLVYVGDDNPRKNLSLAVAATARLRERHAIAARLVRVGPVRFPEATAALRAQAQRVGVDLVEPGYLGDEALAALLSHASCFLWPSLAEGFGFPPLEALACGAPVVAVDLAVNREVLGAQARFASPTPDAMADALADTLAKPGAAGPRVAWASRFTWARAAEGTLAAYGAAGWSA